MKNKIKWFGIITLIEIIGFSFSASDYGNSRNNSSGAGNKEAKNV